MGTVITMYGAIAGGAENAIAQIDVPMPGHLIGVDWDFDATLATDFVSHAQLSFRSAGSFFTNDDRGIISSVSLRYEITTTGSGLVSTEKYVQLPDVPVMGGERLYLHANSTAAVAGNCAVMIHFDFDLDKVSMRRR